MYECGTCGKAFLAGWQARDNHCRSTGHHPPAFECDSCDAYFASEQSSWQHMDAKGHWGSDCSGTEDDSDGSDTSDEEEYWCELCDTFFDDEDDLDDHEIEDHFYCRDCDRSFSSKNGVWNHLDSNAHSGRTVPCPFCNLQYTNAAAVANHVESGNCPYAVKIDRDEVYRLVRSKDPKNLISRRSIFGDPGSAASVKYVADKKAWNGKGYECYFCHDYFKSLNGLNNHINSQAHEKPLYHCSNKDCSAQSFKTLTSTISHLESGKCGAMRPGKVAKLLREILVCKGPICC